MNGLNLDCTSCALCILRNVCAIIYVIDSYVWIIDGLNTDMIYVLMKCSQQVLVQGQGKKILEINLCDMI